MDEFNACRQTGSLHFRRCSKRFKKTAFVHGQGLDELILFGIASSLAWRMDSVKDFSEVFTSFIRGSSARISSSFIEKLSNICGSPFNDFIIVYDFLGISNLRKKDFRSDFEGKEQDKARKR